MSAAAGGAGPALVVPVDVQALVVNRVPQAFRQWRFNYSALASFDSPEPEAGGGQASTQPRSPGVYLHWDLPGALRHGTSDAAISSITYPPVPNRWLVVRFSGTTGRTATGWVVESDCPNSASPSMYLVDDPILTAWTASGDAIRVQGAATVRQSAAGGSLVALLGRAFPLAGGWQERAATATFLTAVAPGNILFSKYETHCANIFTFYDAMTGVSDGDTVSYLVLGWYSNPADDVLATATPTQLGWSVAGPPGAAPTASLCHGLALAVPWRPSATTAPPTPLTALAGNVHAGVGSTTVDAFTALVAGQLGNPAAVDLLRAFQYGLLPSLEAVNGPNLLATAAHQASFGSRPGGLRWEIGLASGAGASADGGQKPDLTSGEATWLLELNQAQAELDAAQASLDAHRWALYAVWWKWRKGLAQSVIVPPEGFDADVYANAVTAVLPALIGADAQSVTAAQAKVPQPVVRPGDTRQDSFERGISRFAASKNLHATKVLKAVAAPRSWRAADPVVVLAGLEPGQLPDPSAPLPCRLATGLVTSLLAGGKTIGAVQLGQALPAIPGVTALPPVVTAAVLEAFLLDPASAGAIATAAGLPQATVTAAITGHPAASYPGQVLPATGLGSWQQQPWQPLLMEWQVGYVPIPDQTGDADNWTFDGLDYRYAGPFGPFPADTSAPVEVLGSISPLTPEAQFTFRSQLQRFVASYPVGGAADPDLKALAALRAAIDTVDSWRFMSQSLAGFGDLVALRDARPQTGPDATVAATVLGQTAGVPYLPNGPVYPFNAVRQGQFAVRFLLVYDTFGQVLQVVGGTGTTDPQNFAPARDAALVPDKPVITRNPARLIEVRPRLMQHSRLDVTLVDAVHDDLPVIPGGPANPVIAWLLPNHLDRGLLLYAPDGRALGEVRLLADTTGTTTAQWRPPPHQVMTLGDVVTAAPRLGAMITDHALADPAAFGTFLDAIDSTLWSIDPLGDRADQNLSVLIGRPLALVRAGLRLSVDGLPVTAMTDWNISWPPPAADFLDRNFSIRLGDLASRQDGLIGFYAGSDYSAFNSVAAPDPDVSQSYVHVIGPVGTLVGGNWLTLQYGAGEPAYVTLLMDPRAAVHAVSGILPAKAITLPTAFVAGSLASLELTFRIGSLLTHPEQSPATGAAPPPYPESMWLPYPAERNGAWSWWEPAGTDWSAYGLLRSTAQARLKDYPNTLRDGYLQFITNLSTSDPGRQELT
ncbi:MAG TPA: hypothetical protein VNF47_04210 [Streptosporangiaceae bacterium]|nr:hypothetical protein [Streptosporangiaceae bacterium]